MGLESGEHTGTDSPWQHSLYMHKTHNINAHELHMRDGINLPFHFLRQSARNTPKKYQEKMYEETRQGCIFQKQHRKRPQTKTEGMPTLSFIQTYFYINRALDAFNTNASSQDCLGKMVVNKSTADDSQGQAKQNESNHFQMSCAVSLTLEWSMALKHQRFAYCYKINGHFRVDVETISFKISTALHLQ